MSRRPRPLPVLLPLALPALLLPALAGCTATQDGDPPDRGSAAENVLHRRLDGTDHRPLGPVRVVGDDLAALGLAGDAGLPPAADAATRVGFVVLGCRPGRPAVLVVDDHHGQIGATFPDPVDGGQVVCDAPEYYAEVFDVPTEVLERSGVSLEGGRGR